MILFIGYVIVYRISYDEELVVGRLICGMELFVGDWFFGYGIIFVLVRVCGFM